MKEIWKTIKNYPNYQVSNLGKVKSLSRIKNGRVGSRYGKLINKKFTYKSKERILKGVKLTTGYLQVSLFSGKYKQVSIHRLVAQAFIPNPEKKPQINHKDGNGLNNNVSNLEWCNASENGLHSYRVLGNEAWQKGKQGETMPTSRSIIQKTLDGVKIKRWGCGLDAVREGGFESSCISRCCRGKSITHKGFKWEYERV